MACTSRVAEGNKAAARKTGSRGGGVQRHGSSEARKRGVEAKGSLRGAQQRHKAEEAERPEAEHKAEADSQVTYAATRN